MKKILITSKMLLIIGALTFGLTSCNKDSVTDDTESVAAQDFNTADVEDDNTQIMADQAQANGDVSDLRTAPVDNSSVDLITSCAVVTRDTISSPRIITIDFGTGCTNANGVTRKGKIIVSYTGAYRETGTVITITSQNYYVNANKIDINRVITNQGEISGHLTFGIHSVRTVTFADGTTSTSTVDKVREWLEGASTPRDFSDDVYRVSGIGSHTSKRGIVYDVSTLTALIRKASCHQFVSGEVKIVRHGATTRYGIIDFGTGECDDVATVTLDNGKSRTISLIH